MIEDKKKLIRELKDKCSKLDPVYLENRKIELMKKISDYDRKYTRIIEQRMAKLYHPNPTLYERVDPVTAIMNELTKTKMEYESLLAQCAIEKSDIAYLDLLIKELENLDNHVIEYSDSIVNKMIQSIEVISEADIKVIFLNGYIYK